MKLESGFSDAATSKRLSSSRKLGERTGLKPAKRRLEAEAGKCRGPYYPRGIFLGHTGRPKL